MSAGSVMQLLGVLCSCSKTEERQPVVRELVPRLYPFFRHTLTSVRLASVLCLHALLDHDSASLEWLSPEVLRPALCLSFQNLVLDIDQALLEKSKVPALRSCEIAGISLARSNLHKAWQCGDFS